MPRAAPERGSVSGGLEDADVEHTGEVVGRGGHGIVYKGVMARAGQPPEDVAVKTLLPGASQRWRRLFDDLRYVVVDESHVYVGGFGADSA